MTERNIAPRTGRDWSAIQLFPLRYAVNNAVGLCMREMRRLAGLDDHASPTQPGASRRAVAVDRDGFSAAVTKGCTTIR